MPVWLVGILEWVVAMALKRLKPEDVKREVADLFELLDNAVQAVGARVTGPFKGVSDEVALAFHECTVEVVKALRKEGCA